MLRARKAATMLLAIAVALVVGGCGDSGATSGYDGHTYASESIGSSSVFDRIFDSGDTGSQRWRDTSIDDSIASSYGTVPGSTAIGSALDATYDDATSSSVFSDLSFDDPSLNDVLATSVADSDGFDAIDAATWDSYGSDSSAKYDTTGFSTGDAELDAMMMEDPAAEDPDLDVSAGIDPEFDPSFAGGYDDF